MMAAVDVYFIALLPVVCIQCASSYIQFVVPGVTPAVSSSIHTSGGVYPYWPNKTVDGNFSQNFRACLHTAASSGITEAWLRIDLQAVRSIKSVKFWYRNDRADASTNTIRLLGYSIRGSTNSLLSDTKVCYSDNSGNLPTVIEAGCKVLARYIWFYQAQSQSGEVPILEICEVQVFGCKTGFYGDNCSKSCDHCVNNKYCDIDTGQCDDLGCALQHQPPSCIDCIPGFYGPRCEYHCNKFCKWDYCNKATGTCLYGCDSGYLSSHCNFTCPKGTFGQNCLKTCGNCLHNTTCNHENGTCPNGCDAGFKGQYCSTPCDDGTFGQDCRYRCSENCLNGEVCDRVDGHCDSCVTGFQRFSCVEKCRNRTFGENCSKQCGGCLNGTDCHHVSGQCYHGCDPGWYQTTYCNVICNNQTFGENCVHQCDGHCINDEPCNRRDGTCEQCSLGWAGKFCNTTAKSLSQTEKNNLVVTIGSVVGVLLILTIVIGVVSLYRKMHARKEMSENVDDINIYDLPYAKKGENDYDAISKQQ